ncbi:MAG: YidC/Oxa1 family membrane protein insertase [Ilumatobacteraceae bacterium]
MTAFLFEGPAWLLAKFYDFVPNYIVAISLIALVVMIITAPLQLKATKGMLEMQRLQPELRKLQQEHRGDRQKLNEEMMKLYQQHKVNPLASCFPLLLQFPVFIIMFQVLHGLTYEVNCAAANLTQGAQAACAVNGTTTGKVFDPKFIPTSSQMWTDLHGQSKMMSWGLDLASRPIDMIGNGFGEGFIYALLVIVLGVLYFVQQKMVAARATMSPTMSATQQKIMQYLPVVFAVFLVFYLTGLVIYYMAQAIFRIALQWYITKRFYSGEHSLGQQATRAGEQAREIAKADPNGGVGLFGQAKKDLAAAKETKGKAAPKGGSGSNTTTVSKRVTPPKNKPTPSGSTGRPPSSGQSGRPTPPASRTQRKK